MADHSECRVIRSHRVRAFVVPFVVALTCATPSRAQNIDSVQTARAEEVLGRVRRYTAGDVQGARALADSLVRGLPADAAMMPEALFAKASIASSAAEAERDYARIVTEYRFAARVPDALMRLAILESARNNRAGALRHLDRLLRDHGESPVRSRASLMAGRMRMDMNDPARGCDLLAAAYASAGPTERDVIDQAQTAGAACPTSIVAMAEREPPPMGIMRAPRAVAVAPVSAVPASTRRAPARVRVSTVAVAPPVSPVARREAGSEASPATPSVVASPPTRVTPPARTEPARAAAAVRTAAPTAAPPTTAPTAAPAAAPTTVPPVASTVAPAAAPSAAGRYGVQFAAYNDRPGAAHLAGVLQDRGISARVEGTRAPFRVRAGRFTTRAEAEAAAVLWRRGGQTVMIVPLGPTP